MWLLSLALAVLAWPPAWAQIPARPGSDAGRDSRATQRGPEQQHPASDDPGYRIRVSTELVVVPVTVKDSQGRLVPGLEVKDFRVLEDGIEQKLSLFAADPFPLAAAVLLDTDLDTASARKLSEGLFSLSAAFGELDEVALYTFDVGVHRALDFTTDAESFLAALKMVKGEVGEGVAPAGGPVWSGPRINGRTITGTPDLRRSARRVTKRLDDAIYAAAQDLKQRDRARRKIILVVSDGANSSDNQVRTEEALALLQRADISVYAIGVSRVWLPGARTVLQRYATATGGDFFPALRPSAIEKVYAHATEQARNQYTLAYVPLKPALLGAFRQIEVRVRRPGLTLLAREGYFPAVPAP